MHRISRRGALMAAAGVAGLGVAHAQTERPALPFLKAVGNSIRTEAGAPVRLNGVAFGNWVWGDDPLPETHHSEADFARVRAMGMNVVRFYLNYRTLEADSAPGEYRPEGWAWIDRNIAWARAAGVGLILNLHVPPGGFQSNGEGRALWEEPVLQRRAVNLWRAIAARYAEEPAILAYDLINEPGVTSSVEQWRDLAQRIARAVREADQRHPVIVERVNSVNRRWDNNEELNFVRIEDPNVIYTFHFYDPFDFTHQGASWVEGLRNTSTRYPDAARGYDKAGLAQRMAPYLLWGERNQVPLYLGEWGAIRQCFEGGRGGVAWVSDMLDLLTGLNLPNTYHAYHEDAFGIYRGGGPVDPANANDALIELFARKLAGQG